MAGERALERQTVMPDRQPAVAKAALSSQPVSAARALQSRLGNRGVLAMMTQESTPAVSQSAAIGPAMAPLTISLPSDPSEREATATAAAVMRISEPAPVSAVPLTAQRAEQGGGGGTVAPPSVTSGIGQAMSGGASLAPSVRGFMEPRFGTDFAGVRVHTGAQAAHLSQQLGARAFTVGNHVFFGQGQYQPDHPQGRELIAHELTHTIQQGGSVQRTIQRDGDDSSIFSSMSADGLVRMAVNAVAPSLTPFLSGGLTNWLETKASSAFEAVFNALMSPARAVSGMGQELAGIFGPILATLQTAAGQIAQNDCTPLREAADKIEKTATRLITPVVEKLQPVVKAIKDFLNAVWEKIGSPIWEWIKQYAAEQWQAIKDLAELIGKAAKWLWDKTASIRSVYAAAWKWLKDKLGIGDGPEGENGLLQWAETKLGAIWDSLKARLAPFTSQLKTIGAGVGGVLLALSPAGPIMAIGAAAAGAIQGLRWLYANWGKGNIIATARVYIQKTLIPPLVNAARRLGAAISNAALSISTSLNNFAMSLAGAAAAMGGGILSFAVSAVQWLAGQGNALAAWANGHLAQASNWLVGALDRLESFMNRVLKFLGRVADVVIDIWGLPVLLGEAIWDAIPACIRDPIADFLGPIILSQIELFQELVKDNEAWQKTKADIGKLIKLVFHDHDLMGAVKAAFDLILRVFKLPMEALAAVAQKAASAWDVVSKRPLEFLKNTVRALGVGFKLLWADKVENLKLGMKGWLMGEIKDTNILIPKDWSDLRQLFDFVASVLGVNVTHVLELVKKKFPEVPVDELQKRIGQVAGVVAWADKAFDVTKTPNENAQGIVDQAKDFAKSLMTSLAEWIAGKVAEEVATVAAAAAASAGLSEIVDVARRVYKVLLAIQRWADRILAMANEALDNVLDIAGGAVDKVGGVFLKLMQRGMPVIIGLLAEQVGLGNVGKGVRDAIAKLRANVDKGIEWLLDKLKAGVMALVRLVKKGVKAITDWWKEPVKFTSADGQPHTLFFEGSDGNLQVIVRSKPTLVEKILKEIISGTSMDPRQRATAKTALEFYLGMIEPHLKKKADEQRKHDLPERLKTLSNYFKELALGADLPEQDEPLHGAPVFSKMFKVSVKNVKKGTEAGGDTDAMKLVTAYGRKRSNQSTSWVRMHMITARVGGPGTPNNWVPAPQAVNQGKNVIGFEEDLVRLVLKPNAVTKKPNVVWVHVHTDSFHKKYPDPGKEYPGPDKMLSYDDKTFPHEVSLKAGFYRQDGDNGWQQETTAVLSSRAIIPPPGGEFVGEALNVNHASVGQLKAVLGISEWFASEIVDACSGGTIENCLQLQKKMALARTRDTKKFDAFMGQVIEADINHRIRFK